MAKPPRTESAPRVMLSVPLTQAQKDAIKKAARRVGLPEASWGRMVLLRETDWDPDADPEFSD